ncbi:MAG TPA: hypothetical protein VJA21_14595 [Verrucomicrobiae bacterium]
MLDERDFFEATKVYGRVHDRAPQRCEEAAANPQDRRLERVIGANQAEAEQCGPTQAELNEADSKQTSKPHHEELKQVSSLLEEGIEQMFQRENVLAGECASLQGKVEDLTRALAQQEAALAREIESRAAAEKNQAAQVAGLQSALEREQHEFQNHLARRDDLLKKTQAKLDSMSGLLDTQRRTADALREEIASLRVQQHELERTLSDARAQAVSEREARLAAEQRAGRAGLALESVKKQLVHHKRLEQQMQAHVASLTSLCGSMETQAAAPAVALGN